MVAAWSRVLAIFLLAASAGAADAQTVYTCRDANGRVLNEQFLPDQCVGEVCAINPLLGARSCWPAREADAEKKRRDAAAKRQRECSELARRRVREDLAFLERYASDEAIESERDRALGELQRRRGEATRQLDALKARQKRLDSEAEFYGPKHPMPKPLRDDIDSIRRLIDAQEAVAASLVKEIKQTNEKFDELRKRRHDLVEKGSTPMRCEEGLAQ